MILNLLVAITLITVTGEGTVHQAKFTDLKLCKEAAHLALYDETIKATDEANAAVRRREYAQAADWEKEHPCHAPTAKEKEFIKKGSKIWIQGSPTSLMGNDIVAVKDGKVCPTQGGISSSITSGAYMPSLGEWTQWRHSDEMRTRSKSDVKVAECIE